MVKICSPYLFSFPLERVLALSFVAPSSSLFPGSHTPPSPINFKYYRLFLAYFIYESLLRFMLNRHVEYIYYRYKFILICIMVLQVAMESKVLPNTKIWSWQINFIVKWSSKSFKCLDIFPTNVCYSIKKSKISFRFHDLSWVY